MEPLLRLHYLHYSTACNEHNSCNKTYAIQNNGFSVRAMSLAIRVFFHGVFLAHLKTRQM